METPQNTKYDPRQEGQASLYDDAEDISTPQHYCPAHHTML